MVRTGLMTAALFWVTAVGGIGSQTRTPDCCAKTPKAVEGRASQTKLRCSLTNKTVDKCCCVDKKGSLHCTLANKDVERCCCVPDESGTKKRTK